MSDSRDAFGFTPASQPARSSEPMVVVAQPGQEVRIVVPDSNGSLRDFGDSRSSPSGRGDSRSSPSGKGDSRSSPSGRGDSRSSPSGKGDAFGFRAAPRGFSPASMTIVAQPGQEIRIRVADSSGGLPGDSRSSPSGRGDSRSSPSGKGDGV